MLGHFCSRRLLTMQNPKRLHHLFTFHGYQVRHQRPLSSTSSQPQSAADLQPPFHTGPSPPRLPQEEQEMFESLQRQSTGAFSTPNKQTSTRASAGREPQAEAATPVVHDYQDSNPPAEPSNRLPGSASPVVDETDELRRVIEARGTGSELHPNVRRGASPEFDGDVNPKTGEVGGPKNEPLRWGSAGEWSYNGRTTDF